MTGRKLRLMAKRLEGFAMLLEAGGEPEREMAEQLRDEVAHLRRWARQAPEGEAPPYRLSA